MNDSAIVSELPNAAMWSRKTFTIFDIYRLLTKYALNN